MADLPADGSGLEAAQTLLDDDRLLSEASKQVSV